jgi:hypothetical protein
LSKKGGVDETSKKTDLQGGRMTEVGRRCTRMRARGRARRQIAHPQWGSTSHRFCHRGRLSLESLTRTSFFSSWVTKGYAWGVGEGKGSDFGRIQSGRPRNRGRALSFMWERCAILGANSSDQFQNHPNIGIIG